MNTRNRNIPVSIIIPILKPEKNFFILLRQIREQTTKNDQIIILDSTPDSDSEYMAIREIISKNLVYKTIDLKAFNHGGTRNHALKLAKHKIVIFMTQDILLTKNSLRNLLKPFINNDIAITYGRQVPHKYATLSASFARNYNYPPVSNIRTYDCRKQFGIKTTFVSNSFAAYRKKDLMQIGGFPTNTILGEDMFVTSKILLKGGKIAYVSNAIVQHSHNYTIFQEMARYFDTGVFHAMNPWIQEKFGKAGGEGIQFMVKETWNLIIQRKLFLIPSSLIRNIMKYLGYVLGKNHSKIPLKFKKRFSMHKNFWNKGL